MKDRILCLCGALLLLASYVFLSLISNYLARYGVNDTFGFGLIFLAGYFGIVFVALWRLVRGVIEGGRRGAEKFVCALAILIAAVISFSFRMQLVLLGDRIFFFANESSFQRDVQKSLVSESAVVVHRVSAINAHKLLLHVGSRALMAGPLTVADIDGLGDPLTPFRGCRAYATPLRNSFHLVRVEC
jgi:hypothetical protein